MGTSNLESSRPRRLKRRWRYTCVVSTVLWYFCFGYVHTCVLINTKSINSTTKSCSTYLSANFLQRGHCVKRTPLPSARSSAFEYSVYSVLTGYRHSMQMGIALRPLGEGWRVWRWGCGGLL